MVSLRSTKKKKRSKNQRPRDFPGGPVVKNLSASAGVEGWSLVWELRSNMPWSN